MIKLRDNCAFCGGRMKPNEIRESYSDSVAYVRVNQTQPNEKHVALDLYPSEGPGTTACWTPREARELAAALWRAADEIER